MKSNEIWMWYDVVGLHVLHGNIRAIENRNDFDTSAAHTQGLADQLDVLCILAISPAEEHPRKSHMSNHAVGFSKWEKEKNGWYIMFIYNVNN